MDYTDAFTSEDDAMMRLRIYENSRDGNFSQNFGRKTPTPKPILRSVTPSSYFYRPRRYTIDMNTSLYNTPIDNEAEIMNAITSNDIERVKHMNLLNKFQSQMFTDKEGRTAVHITAENGLIEMTRYFLQNYPTHNVNIVDKTGSTALHRAAATGSIDIVRLLLERGAQVNVLEALHGNSPLHEAAWKGYSICVDMLCTVSRLPNLVNYALFTPLHLAVQGGHNQTTRNLIRHGADISAQNKFGDTALHTSVRYGHAGVTRIVVVSIQHIQHSTRGSETRLLNCTNQNGDTPLHIAAALKRRKLTRILCDALTTPSSSRPPDSTAKFDISNLQGETPLDVAVKKQHLEIVGIVQEYMGGKSILRQSRCHQQQQQSTYQPEVNQLPVVHNSKEVHCIARNSKSDATTMETASHKATNARTRSESPGNNNKKHHSFFFRNIFHRKKTKKTNSKGDTTAAFVPCVDINNNVTSNQTNQIPTTQRSSRPEDTTDQSRSYHSGSNQNPSHHIQPTRSVHQHHHQPTNLYRSRSDESLNQSHHKLKVQSAHSPPAKKPVVKGRRVVLVSPHNTPPNSKLAGVSRPNPEGQSNDGASLTYPHMNACVDRAAAMRHNSTGLSLGIMPSDNWQRPSNRHSAALPSCYGNTTGNSAVPQVATGDGAARQNITRTRLIQKLPSSKV